MDELGKHLANISAMDRPTLAVLCLLCIASALALKDYLVQPIMIIFVYPLLVVFSILVQYALMLGELYNPRRIDQWLVWTILASICGNMAGIALVGVIGRVREVASRAGHMRRRAAAPAQSRR